MKMSTEEEPLSKEVVPLSGEMEDLSPELDHLEKRHASLEELKIKFREELDGIMEHSRRNAGLNGYKSRQLENLIALEQAQIAAVKASADIKKKRFDQRTKLMDLAREAGSAAATENMWAVAGVVLEKLMSNERKPTPIEQDEDVDAAFEQRLKSLPPGVSDASRFLEPGVPGMDPEIVSLADGKLLVIDDDKRILSGDDRPEGMRLAEGEKAEIRRDEAGNVSAWRDGVELRVVRKGDLRSQRTD